MSEGGKLSTQKKPVSSKNFNTVLLPAPDGADITNRIPSVRAGIFIGVGVLTALFDVLDLLSYAFDFRLRSHHGLRDFGVVRLYRKRIELARDFLDEEF